MPPNLNLKTNEELKFKDKITVRQENNKKQVPEKKKSKTPSKQFSKDSHFSTDRRITENRNISRSNSDLQLNSCYTEIENVMKKLEDAKEKFSKSQEGYKNLHVLAKSMSNNLNYGFQEQEDKQK